MRVEVVMAQPLISSERGEVASVKDMCSEFPLESNCDLMMIMKVNYKHLYFERNTPRHQEIIALQQVIEQSAFVLVG